MKKALIIPRDDLHSGIERCLAKAARLTGDAETLLDAKTESITHASVLFSYAVEELGKAALLADAAGASTKERVRVDGFYDHEAKLRRAEKLAGEDAFTLFPAAFNRRAFSRAFAVGTHASELADRLEALYVDWQPMTTGGRWRREPAVNVSYLRRAIQRMRDVLAEASVTLLEC